MKMETITEFEKRIYLTFEKDIDVKGLDMKDMLYWSKHNIFSYIDALCIIEEKRNQIL